MAKRKYAKSNKLKTNKEVNAKPLKMFMGISPFLIGLFYEWSSGVVCIFLLCYLMYCYQRTGKILILHSTLLFTSIVIPIMYGMSVIWAVDSGMTIFGMAKFLPLPLFVLAAGQLEKAQRQELLDYLPISGVIMVVLSWTLGMISFLKTFFMVNNRLAGFFQYPNTFALYLLVGIVITISNEDWGKKNIFTFVVLCMGIALTGSRTGFLLLMITVLSYCILLKDKKLRLGLAGILIFLLAAAVIVVAVTGNKDSIGRFFTFSFSSSTFLGRLLYYKDALPVILKHPLGLGYMGYYLTQGSFQTGVYSVMNIHNELLQFLLDIGWIPTVLLIWTVIKGIRLGNLRNRMIIIIICLHSMMDFNLQFLAIFFILLSVIDLDEKNTKAISEKIVLAAGGILLGCVSLYFAVASALYYFKIDTAAVSVYPGNTNAWMNILTETEDVEEMETIADKILDLNPVNPLANSAKARVAYSRGDFGNMISYKVKAIEYSKYSLEEYLDYFNMLYVGYQLYMENGDEASAELCTEHIREIPEMIEKVLEETDPLAYKITDKPELELPEEYKVILETLE